MESFAGRITGLASIDEIDHELVVNLGAKPKIFADVIDDSPLQDQIQKNKEGKFSSWLFCVSIGQIISSSSFGYFSLKS